MTTGSDIPGWHRSSSSEASDHGGRDGAPLGAGQSNTSVFPQGDGPTDTRTRPSDASGHASPCGNRLWFGGCRAGPDADSERQDFWQSDGKGAPRSRRSRTRSVSRHLADAPPIGPLGARPVPSEAVELAIAN
jgi:hypothetical protein